MNSIVRRAFKIIDEMSMENFYEKCLTGILHTDEVSKLMTSNVSFLTETEIAKIKESLENAGFITGDNDVTDDDIEDIIRYMSAVAFAQR